MMQTLEHAIEKVGASFIYLVCSLCTTLWDYHLPIWRCRNDNAIVRLRPGKSRTLRAYIYSMYALPEVFLYLSNY